MKKYALILLLGTFLTSCVYEDDYLGFDDNEWLEEDDWGSDDEWDANDGDGEGELTLYQISGSDIDKIKDYAVDEDLIRFQQDEGRHFEMWDFVTRLLPTQARGNLAEFEVFHGGDEVLGYVLPVDDNDLSRWRFGLAIDAAEDLTTIDLQELFTFVVIHEYAHVLTLNDSQVDVSTQEWDCINYFPGEGCSRNTSYIQAFYDLGWADIIDQHDEDNPDATYERYQSRFVSDYAATNPAEDIAEVFSFFVTQESQPSGNTIADQKIRLMYDYPELVEMRDLIRANATVQGLQAGSLGSHPLFKNYAKAHTQAHSHAHHHSH